MMLFNYIDRPTWYFQGWWRGPTNGTWATLSFLLIVGMGYRAMFLMAHQMQSLSSSVVFKMIINPSLILDTPIFMLPRQPRSYRAYFTGVLEFDVSGTGNDQLTSARSTSLATFTFDATNDDVQVVAPLTVSALPSNSYTNTWSTVDPGSITLSFGDADNSSAQSAYISNEVFAAELQDNGQQIYGSSGGSNNLAGVMVSYNTLDKEDADLFHSNGNDPMPNADYATWGFWAMGAVDISPNNGTQPAAVHLGTWVAGELVASE